MDPKHKIDERIMAEVYKSLAGEKYAIQVGFASDLEFTQEVKWLKDATVIDTISKSNEAWQVYLIFTHHNNPLQLIVRKVARYSTEQKAKAAAFYISRDAARESRGTLKLSIESLKLCSN